MPKFKKSTGYSSPMMKKVNNTGSTPFKMKPSPYKIAPILVVLGKALAGAAVSSMAQRQGGKGDINYDKGPNQPNFS